MLESLSAVDPEWRLHLWPGPAPEAGETTGTPDLSGEESHGESPPTPDFFAKLGDVLRQVGGLIADLEREKAGQTAPAEWEGAFVRCLAGSFEAAIDLADLHELRETVLAFTADPNRLSSLRAIAMSADRIALVVDEAIRVRLLVESQTELHDAATEDDSSALAG
jgi:hypothetical protein